MATLTLIHQGHVQGSHHFTGGTITIGSDPSSDIVIAAADVAPLHAAVQFGPGAGILRQGDGDFPVTVNGQPMREHRLKDGDRIGIGGYMLFYVEEASTGQDQADGGTAGQNPNPDGEAFLQWMSGDHIGRVTSLRNSLTRLGKPGQDGAAVVAKRQGGYFFSAIDQEGIVKINGRPVGESTIQLKHGDLLEIGQQQLQFFRES